MDGLMSRNPNSRTGSRLTYAYGSLCAGALVATVVALASATPNSPSGYDAFPLSAVAFVEADDGWTIYDNDDEYWVFSHRKYLCDAAADVGNDGVVMSVLDAGAITDNEVMYLRGVLSGCA